MAAPARIRERIQYGEEEMDGKCCMRQRTRQVRKQDLRMITLEI